MGEMLGPADRVSRAGPAPEPRSEQERSQKRLLTDTRCCMRPTQRWSSHLRIYPNVGYDPQQGLRADWPARAVGKRARSEPHHSPPDSIAEFDCPCQTIGKGNHLWIARHRNAHPPLGRNAGGHGRDQASRTYPIGGQPRQLADCLGGHIQFVFSAIANVHGHLIKRERYARLQYPEPKRSTMLPTNSDRGGIRLGRVRNGN